MTTKYDSTVSVHYADIKGSIRLIDPLGGEVYQSSMLEQNGRASFTLKNIPLRDYPLIITFGDFIQ